MIREKTVGGFAGQARAGASEGRADGGGELLPAWRPLYQELGGVVEVDGRFELESVGHGELLRNAAPNGA